MVKEGGNQFDIQIRLPSLEEVQLRPSPGEMCTFRNEKIINNSGKSYKFSIVTNECNVVGFQRKESLMEQKKGRRDDE